MNILRATFRILNSFSVSRLMVLALYFLAAQPHAEILTTYYHNDALGSPVAATNELGKVIWKENYMPYGSKVENQDLKTNNRIGYTGHEHDPDTGLTYMQARYYDPVLGRFYAVDPVGFVETNPLSFNRYAYANNNPYKYTDPDGQFAILAIPAWELIQFTAGVALGWWVEQQVDQPKLNGLPDYRKRQGADTYGTPPNGGDDEDPLPELETNDKHIPGRPGYNRSAGTQPKDYADAYKNSIEYNGVRYARSADGKAIYRYSNNGNGTYHWSGSTRDVSAPLTRNRIPDIVRKALGFEKATGKNSPWGK
ncbi:RHS repeat-associated core domain-containing protein [Gynuella sp.]|uniref:RHS repeat-associated core domain-containing protein n=1 Tax=Gynuella sp. TaxID=2969146 RepID=UPI003D11F3B5